MEQVMVKLELNLPWVSSTELSLLFLVHLDVHKLTLIAPLQKPILAWPWGVSYLIDENTFLVTKHIESWDIGAWEVSFVLIIYLTSNRFISLTQLFTSVFFLGRTANFPQANVANKI